MISISTLMDPTSKQLKILSVSCQLQDYDINNLIILDIIFAKFMFGNLIFIFYFTRISAFHFSFLSQQFKQNSSIWLHSYPLFMPSHKWKFLRNAFLIIRDYLISHINLIIMESSLSQTSKTLWIGDLQTWMDEPYLQSVITSLGYGKQLSSIKIIKDKATGLPLKYGFVQFNTHDNANSFYQNYNNRVIPNTSKPFKLNWAAYGSSKSSAVSAKPGPQEIQIYIGDIDPSITEHKLLQLFRAKYPSAYMSKIITDGTTKVSKGYGFVKFTNNEESVRAIAEMNGQMLMGKAIKVSTAYLKTKEEALNETQQTQNQLLLRQRLYTQFYSSLNDPQMKAEYEKQILKTFGSQDGKKLNLKHSLEQVPGLSYNQTCESEDLLKVIPRAVTNYMKYEMQRKIYQ